MSYYNSGSRRGGYPGRPTSRTPYIHPSDIALPTDRAIKEGLLPASIKTISKPTEVPRTSLELKELTYIGSYNWVDATQPTIIVPGSPPEWQNRSPPFQVQPDTGVKFVDQNGFRTPSSPMLPLFRAVDVVAEENVAADLDWGALDFVTDRNNLRKLLRWLNDVGDGTLKDFRIDTQLAGKHTVLLNRWEKRTRETMPGNTFGFAFEKATTKPVAGCEQSTGHHRIVKYDMDGLDLVVRFEVDGCLPQAQPKTTAPARSVVATGGGGNVDDLSDLLSGLKVSSMSATNPPPGAADTSPTPKSDVTIIRAGHQVSQNTIIELTTRSERNAANLDWSENYPQLFLSQTAQHILGVHARGNFRRVESRKLDSQELRSVERSGQRVLKQLRVMLKVIQDLVIEHGQRGRLSLVCEEGILKVYERKDQDSCLPDDVIERFAS